MFNRGLAFKASVRALETEIIAQQTSQSSGTPPTFLAKRLSKPLFDFSNISFVCHSNAVYNIVLKVSLTHDRWRWWEEEKFPIFLIAKSDCETFSQPKRYKNEKWYKRFWFCLLLMDVECGKVGGNVAFHPPIQNSCKIRLQ